MGLSEGDIILSPSTDFYNFILIRIFIIIYDLDIIYTYIFLTLQFWLNE